jgi:hypothetical protein
MHKHGKAEPPDTSLGFEQSDLSIPAIIRGVMFYFAFTAFVGVAAIGFLMFRGAYGPPRASEMMPRRVPAEPNPVLQNDITARTDIWNLRAREEFLLHNYVWLDQKKGLVSLPIEKAIDLAAAAGPSAAATLQSVPGASTLPSATNVSSGNRATGASVPPNKTAGSGVLRTNQADNKPPLEGQIRIPQGAPLRK